MSALIFYIIIYSILTVLLFSLLVFSIITQVNFPAFIANWTSSSLRNYTFIISFTLVLFSIAGIPPLAGFFSKMTILLAIIAQKYYITALFIVIVSSIGCFYYIRLIKTFFFIKTSKISFWISSSKRQAIELPIGVLMFLNLTFCVYPDLLSLVATSLSLILL
jgi:NADH-quinone oxidoreductase subunit N